MLIHDVGDGMVMVFHLVPKRGIPNLQYKGVTLLVDNIDFETGFWKQVMLHVSNSMFNFTIYIQFD